VADCFLWRRTVAGGGQQDAEERERCCNLSSLKAARRLASERPSAIAGPAQRGRETIGPNNIRMAADFLLVHWLRHWPLQRAHYCRQSAGLKVAKKRPRIGRANFHTNGRKWPASFWPHRAASEQTAAPKNSTNWPPSDQNETQPPDLHKAPTANNGPSDEQRAQSRESKKGREQERILLAASPLG